MFHKFSELFLPKWKKMETKKKLYVVAFDPIKILTLKAPQNDRLNLSFVKDFYVVAKKWPEMVIKWPFMSQKISVFFLTKLKIKGNDKNCDSCCSV